MKWRPVILKLRDQFNLSLTEIGKRVGGKVLAQSVTPCDFSSYQKEVIELLSAGVITEGQARPLIELSQIRLLNCCRRLSNTNILPRQIEALIKQAKKRPQDLKKRYDSAQKGYRHGYQKLSGLLDAKTRIKPLVNGS